MKDSCHNRNKRIYQLWEGGLTPEQIAHLPMCQPLSHRRIQNIVYGQAQNERDQQIQQHYQQKLIAGYSPKEALELTHDQQPPEHLSPRTIRAIIAREREKRIRQKEQQLKRHQQHSR